MPSLRQIIDRGLAIVPYPHPALRAKCVPVVRWDDDLRDLARGMFDLMYEADGLGLAAPQVGVPLRLFVMNVSEERNPAHEKVFVNPVLVPGPGHRTVRAKLVQEGCLSMRELSGLPLMVERPGDVWVEYEGLGREKSLERYSGLAAQVVAHESDHLDGTLFTDRVRPDIAEAVNLKGWLDYMSTQWAFLVSAGRPPSEALQAELDEFAAEYSAG